MHKRTHRASGQSLVEMALLLPFMLLLLFGIIDLGWYIFGYATVYQAARNGAEKAAEAPPYFTKAASLDRSDPCVGAIFNATVHGVPEVLFTDLASGQNGNTLSITYPTGKRVLGEPIRINLVYHIQPLTPLWRLVMFGNQGVLQVQQTTQRSIESLGDNPNAPNLIACQQ